jgi:hypothetical protein
MQASQTVNKKKQKRKGITSKITMMNLLKKITCKLGLKILQKDSIKHQFLYRNKEIFMVTDAV